MVGKIQLGNIDTGNIATTDNALSGGTFGRESFVHYWKLFH